VGTRFHSVILSLAAGTPALAISYHGYKTKGIMEMLDLGELVFDIDNLEQASLEKVFFDTYHNRADYSEKIRKRVQEVVLQNHHEIKTMLELI
jgi:colanic acid/amylovoran biosynthesis protein